MILQIFFIILIIIENFYTRGFQGSITILENYIGPFIFFILIILSVKDEKQIKRIWINKVFGMAIILAFFALIEFITHLNPYSTFYSEAGTAYNSYIVTGYRSFTSVGHPLNNALFFLSAMPFVFFLKTKSQKYFIHLLLLLGIVATGSRLSSVIALSFILFFYLYLSNVKKWKIIYLVIVFFIFSFSLYFIISYTSLTDFLFSRFANDYGSSQIRYIAINYFKNNWDKYIFSSIGVGGTRELSSSVLGSEHSFEIPWLIMLVEMGIIPLIIYLSAMTLPFYAYLRNRKFFHRLNSAKIVLISYSLMLLSATGYSSVGVKSHFNYLFYGIVAISFIYIDLILEQNKVTNNRNISQS